MSFVVDELEYERGNVDPLWTIGEGINFIRELEPKLREVGFHCGLTGSVLYQGFSEKDLDVIIYPHDTTKADWNLVEKMLKDEYNIQINKIDRLKYPDEKCVFWSEYKTKRIDFFFMK